MMDTTTQYPETETMVAIPNDSHPSSINPSGLETIVKGHPKTGVTLLFNGTTRRHDYLIEGMFRSLGYQAKRLPTPDVDAFQTGKEFGNNGQCNPTYFTVGNLVKFLRDLETQGMSRQEINERYAFFTFGANGPCRFGMYVEEYKLALRNAGFPDFRIEVLDRDGGINQKSENKSLVKLDLNIVFGLLSSFILGDVLNSIGYKIRPYEVNGGETDKVMAECMGYLTEFMENQKPFKLNGATRILEAHLPGWYEGLNNVSHFVSLLTSKKCIRVLRHCQKRLSTIKVDRTRVKPTVKVIGEFWAQTTEGDGNFKMFSFLEKEGAQVIVEPTSTWIPYLLHLALDQSRQSQWEQGHSTDSWLQRIKRNATQRWGHGVTNFQLRFAEKVFVREYARHAKVFGDLPTLLIDQQELAGLAGDFYNTLADGGEGHLEIAKSIHYTTHAKGHMILSLKPFGCMPSTQSDGAMTGVISRFKEMIYLPIETSGEGEINAHSRVQMALGEAKHKSKAEFEKTVAKVGYGLDQVGSYVTANPELESPTYQIPRSKGVVGTAANFVLHVADRMKWEGIKQEVTS